MIGKICSKKTVPDREVYRKTFILQKYIQELPPMDKSSENPKLGSAGVPSPLEVGVADPQISQVNSYGKWLVVRWSTT